MAHTADIFEERESWGGPLGASVIFHGVLVGLITLWAGLHGFRADMFGSRGSGPAGSISVNMVNSVPLPAQQSSPSENVLANPSKGLSQSPPKPAEQAPPDAVPIPDRNARNKPRAERPAPNKPSTVPAPQPQNQNVVPFGQGGPANAVQFSMGGGTGGLSVTGTGDFEGLFGWYVEQMKRKVGQTWAFYQVDSRVPKGTKVTLAFVITRSGQPVNVAVQQSSGYPTLDQSALDTLKRIDTFGPLPDGYRGSNVTVNFYFEAR